VHVGEQGNECACLISYARCLSLNLFDSTESIEQIARINQAIVYALGAERRAVIEIASPTKRPPLVP
jgi:hypothetical protein